MGKFCPLLFIANEGKHSFSFDLSCMKSDCALWNETQSRCGLACTSQPEQPSKQPLSVTQIQLAKMMPVMLVKLKTGDNHIGFLEGVAEEGTLENQDQTVAKFWWCYMDFADEYRMDEYEKTWVMYPYYPVSPIGI